MERPAAGTTRNRSKAHCAQELQRSAQRPTDAPARIIARQKFQAGEIATLRTVLIQCEPIQ
jgi:hypothetical protein